MVKWKLDVSVFMDNIVAAGAADNIRKGIQNCRRLEIEKNLIYRLKKTK